MNISRAEVAQYLSEVFSAVKANKYQIANNRPKNQKLYMDYVFTEDDAKNIVLSLSVDDFSDAVPNDHPNHPEETLYIFGKDVNLLPRFGGDEETVSLYIKFNKLINRYVIIISLHKQERPLYYKFK